MPFSSPKPWKCGCATYNPSTETTCRRRHKTREATSLRARKSRKIWTPKTKSEAASPIRASSHDESCASSPPKPVSTESSLPYVGSQPSYPESHSTLSAYLQRTPAQSSSSQASNPPLSTHLAESSSLEAFDFMEKYPLLEELYPKTVLNEPPMESDETTQAFDDSDPSLYKLYFNDHVTKSSWHKYRDSREFNGDSLKNQNRWESKGFDVKLVWFKGGKGGGRPDRPSGVHWNHEKDRVDLVCWRYCKTKAEEERCLSWIRKGRAGQPFSASLINQLNDDRNEMGSDEYLTRIV